MMKEFLGNSYLFGGNAPFIEELYEATCGSRLGRRSSGASYFDELQLLPTAPRGRLARADRRSRFAQLAQERRPRAPRSQARTSTASSSSVLQLIAEYRFRGVPARRPRSAQAPGEAAHRRARSRLLRPDRSRHGHRVQHRHADRAASRRRCARSSAGAAGTYCRTLGVEYMYISSTAPEALDPGAPGADPLDARTTSPDYKKHILERLTAAEDARALPAHALRRAEALLAARAATR